MIAKIFTIGHSTHAIEHFIGMLNAHNITAIGDVRSKPYSARQPQFNREALKKHLRDAGIAYVFLGDELGARTSDPCCYDEHGKVQYDLLAKTSPFIQGLHRIQDGLVTHRIALMCAEKDPLDCHRTILVSRYLQEHFDLNVHHILATGQLESHEDAMDRLRYQLKLPAQDMFRSHEAILAEAYKIQGQKIAYTIDQTQQALLEPWAVSA